MENAVTARGLAKTYGRSRVLDGLDLNVPRGAIYGLVGKNGAGKTTLLRLLCGLSRPSGGEFTLFGIHDHDREINRARGRVGAVIETPSLYTDLTAEDNMRCRCLSLGLPDYSCIRGLLETVGLPDTGRKRVRSFSLGMRQRLGIALALCGSPDLLILDEPVNGLDPEGMIEIRELILDLNRERGVTVLISSHILSELDRLATHIGFLDGGRVVREVPVSELRNGSRRRSRLRVSDTSHLPPVLDALGLEYEVISKQEARVFGDLDIASLASALAGTPCRLLGVSEETDSLESAYIDLIGGGGHVEQSDIVK